MDNQIAYIFPYFLPVTEGSRGLVYSFGPGSSDRKLGVLDIKTGERRELVPGTAPVYSTSGHLVYQESFDPDSGLRAVPFSVETLTPIGEAFPIVEAGRHPSVALTRISHRFRETGFAGARDEFFMALGRHRLSVASP